MPELPSVYSTGKPKARREHKCCECRGTIFKGERYHLFNGCWDGRWGVYKTCDECEILRNAVTAEIKDQEDWPPFGELYEDVFASRHSNPDRVRNFLATRRRRNAPESHRGWMEEIEKEIQ